MSSSMLRTWVSPQPPRVFTLPKSRLMSPIWVVTAWTSPMAFCSAANWSMTRAKLSVIFFSTASASCSFTLFWISARRASLPSRISFSLASIRSRVVFSSLASFCCAAAWASTMPVRSFSKLVLISPMPPARSRRRMAAVSAWASRAATKPRRWVSAASVCNLTSCAVSPAMALCRAFWFSTNCRVCSTAKPEITRPFSSLAAASAARVSPPSAPRRSPCRSCAACNRASIGSAGGLRSSSSASSRITTPSAARMRSVSRLNAGNAACR